MCLYEFYSEELTKKKTTSSKKAFLTRCKKEVEGHHKDLMESGFGGWLHGEIVTHARVQRVRNEIQVITNFYKQLEQNGNN